ACAGAAMLGMFGDRSARQGLALPVDSRGAVAGTSAANDVVFPFQPRLRAGSKPREKLFKMRNNWTSLVLAMGAVLVFSSFLRAQAAAQSGAPTARVTSPTVDLSGVWEANM